MKVQSIYGIIQSKIVEDIHSYKAGRGCYEDRLWEIKNCFWNNDEAESRIISTITCFLRICELVDCSIGDICDTVRN